MLIFWWLKNVKSASWNKLNQEVINKKAVNLN